MQDNFQETVSHPKRSRFLNVLLVLTTISLAWFFFTNVLPMFSGPMNAEQLEQEEVRMAKAMVSLSDFFEGEESKQALSESFDFSFSRITYIHTRAFGSYYTLQFIIFLICSASVYFMFKLNKIGFHLYIIYSLLRDGGLYLVLPSNLIAPSEPLLNLAISGVFVFMYYRNLKDFEPNSGFDSNGFEYNN